MNFFILFISCLFVFTDANASLEQLRASHESASGILGEFTPIKKMSDLMGLRHYLQDMHAKHNVGLTENHRIKVLIVFSDI